MAAISSLSFSALGQSSERKVSVPSGRSFASNFDGFRLRTNFSCGSSGYRTSNSTSQVVIRCMSTVTDVPTVSETKLNFLKAYKRPIPSIYNTVLQELIVQQHLMRYKKTYRYDAVFALGFVTVYDQLMEGYPSDEDREAIFLSYIKALKEDPDKYRNDAKKLEEWARAQNATSLVNFSSGDGEVEEILKDIAERAGGKGSFSYSRFFAIGLFRLLELANATEPTILEQGRFDAMIELSSCNLEVTGLRRGNSLLRMQEPLGYEDREGRACGTYEIKKELGVLAQGKKLDHCWLCAALNINKRSVDRDLDVYRNLLSKLVQAKELLKEYIDREKKKREERADSQKANEAITKCLGEYQHAGQ